MKDSNGYQLNSEISFVLDGWVYGKGMVKAIFSHSVEVELIIDCKEFNRGSHMLVRKSEIID